MPKTVTESTPKTATVAYDVSEQLRTPEEMAAYLDAWFVDAPDDAAGITRALGDIALAQHSRKATRGQDRCDAKKYILPSSTYKKSP